MGRKYITMFRRREKSGLISKIELCKLLDKEELIISPLLELNQIGEISTDLRIGTDFLAMHQGRVAYIDTTDNSINKRPIRSSFTETRRRLGETFLLHPSQPVLFSTLEYIKLPENVYAILTLRSSYSRLGLTISTIVQPGYCGCISVEVVNTGNTPINIISGARFIQARFIRINNQMKYFTSPRKYTCQVRPVASKANEDVELVKLKKLKFE